MTFADALLWMAGVSWLMTAIIAVRRAVVGDWLLVQYLCLMVAVAVPLSVVFPAALAWVLGLLWIVTLVIPGLLMRRLQVLTLQRRLPAALIVGRWLTILQPIGPYAHAAKLSRFQCLRELGRTSEAASLVQRLGTLSPAQQWQLDLCMLWSEQRWPEMLTLLRDRPAVETRTFRMRARAETGDIRGMLVDFQAVAGVLEGQRLQYRQALAIILAFGGQRESCESLLADFAPDIRTFWSATATWAAGDETMARKMLDGIRDPNQPCLEAAITWRLAHPPAPVSSWDAETLKQLDLIAEATRRSLVMVVGRPWLTWAILAGCAAMFWVTESATHHLEALRSMGAFEPSLGWIGNSWRYVASAFLHVNGIHILMNGMALLIFAPVLERALGWWRFLALYLGAAIGGMALVQVSWYCGDGRPEIVVGASASIMGLIGAELVRIIRWRVPGEAWWRHPQIRRMGLILAIQVAFDLMHPSVSQAGHIGGFLMGFGLAWVLVPGDRRMHRS